MTLLKAVLWKQTHEMYSASIPYNGAYIQLHLFCDNLHVEFHVYWFYYNVRILYLFFIIIIIIIINIHLIFNSYYWLIFSSSSSFCFIPVLSIFIPVFLCRIEKNCERNSRTSQFRNLVAFILSYKKCRFISRFFCCFSVNCVLFLANLSDIHWIYSAWRFH